MTIVKYRKAFWLASTCVQGELLFDIRMPQRNNKAFNQDFVTDLVIKTTLLVSQPSCWRAPALPVLSWCFLFLFYRWYGCIELAMVVPALGHPSQGN